MESTSWDDVYNETNPSISYDIFLRKVQDNYERAFPLKEVNKYKNQENPGSPESYTAELKLVTNCMTNSFALVTSIF